MEYSRSVPPPSRRRYDAGVAPSSPPGREGNTTTSPRDRFQDNNNRKQRGSDDTDDTTGRDHDYYDDDDDNDKDPNDPSTIIPLLALQVYHLPGNSYRQDWWQFLANNHPIFGICCRHRLHPIKTKTRLVALIGTIVFGLIITNIFYFLYLWRDNLDQIVATIVIPGSSSNDSSSNGSDSDAMTNGDGSFTLTTGMLLLWTVGGGIHTAYNLVIWHVAACACCRPGGCCSNCACCPNLGKRIVRIFVILVIGFASVLILMRVAINQQQQEWLEQEKDNWLDAAALGGDNSTTAVDDTSGPTASDVAANAVNEIISSRGEGSASSVIDGTSIIQNDVQQLDFVWSYMIEMILAFFVYYPIGATVLFSGILGCGGKLPLVGGRPREVMLEQKQLEERAEKRKAEHIRRQKEIQQRRQYEEIQRRRHVLRAQQMRNEIMQLRSIPKSHGNNGTANNRSYDDSDIISPASSNTTATTITSSLGNQVQMVVDEDIVRLGPSFDDEDDIELAWCPRTEQEFYQRRGQQQDRRNSH